MIFIVMIQYNPTRASFSFSICKHLTTSLQFCKVGDHTKKPFHPQRSFRKCICQKLMLSKVRRWRLRHHVADQPPASLVPPTPQLAFHFLEGGGHFLPDAALRDLQLVTSSSKRLLQAHGQQLSGVDAVDIKYCQLSLFAPFPLNYTAVAHRYSGAGQS